MFNSKRSSEISRNDRVETVIGEDTAIEGNVKTSGVVRIDGTLKGEGVCGGSMIISSYFLKVFIFSYPWRNHYSALDGAEKIEEHTSELQSQ